MFHCVAIFVIFFSGWPIGPRDQHFNKGFVFCCARFVFCYDDTKGM
jgi:hypothetical protein